MQRRRNIRFTTALLIATVALVFPLSTFAQEETSPPQATSSLPQLEKQNVWAEELGSIFGKEFSLTTDPEEGQISYELAEPDGLKFFQAKFNVHIKSESFEMNCDKMEFFGDENKLIATGNPIFIRQGVITARCGRFEYNQKSGRSQLSENPVIFSKDEMGREVQTVGKTIYIEQGADEELSIMVEGNAKLDVRSASQAVKATPTPAPTGPVKVDSSTIDKLKEVEITE